MKFKVGDRVNIYGAVQVYDTLDFIVFLDPKPGTIHEAKTKVLKIKLDKPQPIPLDREPRDQTELAFVVRTVPHQCRLLKKKKRKRVWVGKHEGDTVPHVHRFEGFDPTINYGEIEFIEVLQKTSKLY